MYSNVDSFRNKRNEIETIIEDKKPKIICFTEVFAKNQKDVNLAEYTLQGYDEFLNENPDLGVIIYVDKKLKAREVHVLNNHKFKESQWVEFTTREKEKVLIGCIYRSPSSLNSNTQLMFDLLSNKCISNYDKIMGDFNLPELKWNNSCPKIMNL